MDSRLSRISRRLWIRVTSNNDKLLTISEISTRRQVSAALEAVNDYFHRVFGVEMRRVKRFLIGHVQQFWIVLSESETKYLRLVIYSYFAQTKVT